MGISKQKILDAIRKQILDEIKINADAAEIAMQAATHEESIPEDPHDTRSVEASYLAAGQVQRVQELRASIKILEEWHPHDFSATDSIDLGALVWLQFSGKDFYYFLSPSAGGHRVDVDGKTINLITVQSVLGEALLDHKQGDEIEIETHDVRAYKIKSVS